MTARHAPVIVLGSGPAGYTAALYAARGGHQPLLLTGVQKGGQLVTTSAVENWPAEHAAVLGVDLMDRFEAQAVRFGAEILFDEIASINLTKRPFRLTGAEGEYTCDALIIATGASPKYLGLPAEQRFLGRGVSTCATCDGYFFKGQPVAVIGGGDTAVQDAIDLSNIASGVTLVHRREEFSATAVLVERLKQRVAQGRITLALNEEVEDILGNDAGVTGVRLRSTADAATQDLDVAGVFIAIGHQPNTALFRGVLDTDAAGYLLTRGGPGPGATATNIEGVFAAGDVRDPVYRQAVTSAGSGCQAALDAGWFLDGA
ncbi:MAG: thioredoxin-disulfide reductase [Dehalococcoidia bacterium]|nr:MAG: thioredoxin-disulfide reductase [Dehalococcoidia bacterium]